MYIAAFAQAACLWVATEKLFMTEIGFDAATMGLMAAIYAAFVPFVEVPSGILADRWSRRGVLIGAGVALFLATLIGGLSQSVPVYIISALVLGVYFAMASGTFDAVIYDTVLEETNSSEEFEKHAGKYRLFMSLGGLTAAVAGGLVAAATSPRMTYFLSLPIIAVSIFILFKFKEPRLHKMEVAMPLREHIAVTYRTLLRKGALLPIVGMLVLSATLVQLLLEFGSLWLIFLGAPVAFYGVAFGLLIAAPGMAGFIAGKVNLSTPALRIVMAVLLAICGLSLVFVTNPYLVATTQAILLIIISAATILFTRLLHDSVVSNVRTGVASGIGAFSWILFVPVALVFGWLANEYTPLQGGWLVAALSLVAGYILLKAARPARAE